MKKKEDFYDRSVAVKAMYELANQGFVQIALELFDKDHPKYPGGLLLHCNHWEITTPNIDIDCIDSYYLTPDQFKLQGWAYWWVFD